MWAWATSLLCSAWWLMVVLPAVSSQGFLPVNSSQAFPAGVPDGQSGPGLSWADVDQDNLLDLFLFGGGGWLYHNDGNWTFSSITTAPFPLFPIYLGNSKWADFNQDGFPDLLVWGESDLPHMDFAMLLRNDEGGRNFTDVTNETLPALAACQHTSCVMEWGDFDGDQRVDLFVSTGLGASTVCLNNGIQPTTFTEVNVSATFAGVILVSYGEVRAGDFDGDGKDDLVWVMNNSSGLYRSNGDGTFTDVTKSIMAEGSSLPSLSQSSADWGDVNGDQRLDLVVCGGASTLSGAFSAVFVQTEEGQFRDSTAELFPGDLLPQVRACAVRFVDFDGDALLDLAITGEDPSVYVYYGALLRNNGVIFEDVTDVEFSSPPPLPLQFENRMEWVDVDGNRSPDFSSFNSDGVLLQRNTRAFPEDESSSSSSSSSQPSSSSSTSSSPESNESDDGDDDLWWQVTVPVVVVVLVALCVVALLVVMLVNRKKKKRKQKSKSEQLL